MCQSRLRIWLKSHGSPFALLFQCVLMPELVISENQLSTRKPKIVMLKKLLSLTASIHFVICCTGNYQFDNFQCSQWQNVINFMAVPFQVANHYQMAPVTSVPEPYNRDWSSRRSVIGHNWFLNDQLWLSDNDVCLLYEQWQQCLKILDFNCRLGCKKKYAACFFVQNDRPAKWRWCQICQHCGKLWWSSYIETAAEMLPKDGSSKVAWPFRPCNVCLFFSWHRATMKLEGFLMVVCCLQGGWILLNGVWPMKAQHSFVEWLGKK